MMQVTLRNILECTEVQINLVRDIRNQLSVRQSMYTDHEITSDEHSQWAKGLEKDTSRIVFVVFVDEKVSGVVSLDHLDRLHKKADWAFYLDENIRGGLGAVLEYTFLNFVFSIVGLAKLNCEVIETNKSVVKMHKKFCFEEEGFRRENVEKNGKRIGVYFLGITKSDWAQSKEAIAQKYESVFQRFVVSIEYSER